MKEKKSQWKWLIILYLQLGNRLILYVLKIYQLIFKKEESQWDLKKLVNMLATLIVTMFSSEIESKFLLLALVPVPFTTAWL